MAAQAGLDVIELRGALGMLTVEAEPSRVGYDRDLFPHWQDVNGSGCSARQDALLAQVVGFPQVDVFDRCVVVEGDWYSPFDGLTHSGQPGDVDIDHVVALSEAWDSGADVWPLELRRQFANDPINLVVSSPSANSSKGDRDAGEWKPPQRNIWCLTAAVMVSTKARYELSIDVAERDGLVEMLSTCDEPGQLTVPGVPLPGTDGHASLPPVDIPAPVPTVTPPAPAAPTVDSADCQPGQVNINTADEADLFAHHPHRT